MTTDAPPTPRRSGRPFAACAAPAVRLRRGVAVVANPAAGRLRGGRSRGRLDAVARSLGAPVLGLDCASAPEFRSCVGQASREFEVLLVAGGDGTFTDALNSERGPAALGYLPFGTGNALAWALGLPGARGRYLERVRRGEGRAVGIMRVDGTRKAFFASIGIDALTVRKYNEARLGHGLGRYALAFAAALAEHDPADLEIRDAATVLPVPRALATIISKHPFYGYGLRVNRGAITDPCLHVRAYNRSRLASLKALAAAALKVAPTTGVFHRGTAFTIACDRDQALQLDGEWGGTGREFHFEMLPGSVRLIL